MTASEFTQGLEQVLDRYCAAMSELEDRTLDELTGPLAKVYMESGLDLEAVDTASAEVVTALRRRSHPGLRIVFEEGRA